jgi:hypothetical protein
VRAAKPCRYKPAAEGRSKGELGTLPPKSADAERSPQGKGEAGAGFDSAPFDFAALRSGPAGKYLAVGEDVYESSVV